MLAMLHAILKRVAVFCFKSTSKKFFSLVFSPQIEVYSEFGSQCSLSFVYFDITASRDLEQSSPQTIKNFALVVEI